MRQTPRFAGSTAKAITRQQFRLLTLTTMRRTAGVDRIVDRIIRALYG